MKVMIKIIHSKKNKEAAVVYDGDTFDYFVIKGEKMTLYDIITEIKKEVDESNYKKARNMIREISILVHQHKDENIRSYFEVVHFYYFNEKINDKKDEFYYHKLFKNNCEKLFPDLTLIKKESISRHYPDAWVESDNEEVPVEIKLKNFDARALKQFNRYIDVYGKNKGIAIGKVLTVDLPPNIRFISLDELE